MAVETSSVVMPGYRMYTGREQSITAEEINRRLAPYSIVETIDPTTFSAAQLCVQIITAKQVSTVWEHMPKQTEDVARGEQ